MVFLETQLMYRWINRKYKFDRNRLNTILRNEKKKYCEKKFKEVEGCVIKPGDE